MVVFSSMCIMFRSCELPIDGWRVVDDDYGQAVGKLQAESMMSTAASFSLSKKPRFVDQEKKRQYD
jgi:hypothetical protein